MTTKNTIPASPKKLRDGSWGALVQGAVIVGDTLRITTRAGKSWDAQVTRVIWTGNNVSICTTESAQPRRNGGSRYNGQHRGGKYSCGYPCPVSGRRCTDSDLCHDCQ